MTTETMCHCGKPLHYSDAYLQACIEYMVDKLGRFVKVTVGDESWAVDRHFVALHGLKAQELPSLGFEKL